MLPVNCCVLDKLVPNTLLPQEYTILEVTCCTFIVWATICPVAVMQPFIVKLPLPNTEPVMVWFPIKVLELVVAYPKPAI